MAAPKLEIPDPKFDPDVPKPEDFAKQSRPAGDGRLLSTATTRSPATAATT